MSKKAKAAKAKPKRKVKKGPAEKMTGTAFCNETAMSFAHLKRAYSSEAAIK